MSQDIPQIHLDQYVIGQDRAKQVLAVAVVNHYKRISNPDPTALVPRPYLLPSL